MSSTVRQQVKATTTATVEPARGACPGGTVYTTVVKSIVTIHPGTEDERRYVEDATYVSPTEPVGSYYGQRVGCGWTPVYLG